MSLTGERRKEKRLRYNWPVWFGEDFNDVLIQGQMVDLNSKGASFTCYADRCPYEGGHITARFSVPRYGGDESFDLDNFIRNGRVYRIDELSPFIRRVVVQFAQCLPFKPAEDAEIRRSRQDRPHVNGDICRPVGTKD